MSARTDSSCGEFYSWRYRRHFGRALAPRAVAVKVRSQLSLAGGERKTADRTARPVQLLAQFPERLLLGNGRIPWKGQMRFGDGLVRHDECSGKMNMTERRHTTQAARGLEITPRSQSALATSRCASGNGA